MSKNINPELTTFARAVAVELSKEEIARVSGGFLDDSTSIGGEDCTCEPGHFSQCGFNPMTIDSYCGDGGY